MASLQIKIIASTLLTGTCLNAQWQDRLFPFAELTEEMRAQIDLRDGSVEDWLEVLGEPTLTPLDFATPPSYPDYDPSSFDFRIWLAWHDATDHLFVAAEMVDDLYINVYDTYDSSNIWPGDASVWFHVDGDESGGSIFDLESQETPYHMKQAQMHIAFPIPHSNGNHLILYAVSDRTDWVHLPPYADSGGALLASQPIHAIVEFYVTPFDRLIWNDKEQSVSSDLSAGKTIRFFLRLIDTDTDPLQADRYHDLLGPNASYDGSLQQLSVESDLWARGLLVEAEYPADGTAAESVTWARIKASLSE